MRLPSPWRGARLAALLTGLSLLPGPAAGQTGAPRNDVTGFVEPAAAGVRYLRFLGDRVSLGAEVTGGPRYGVVIGGEADRVRTWGTIYPVLGYTTPGGLQFTVSPIGGGILIGNDFGTIYPSGQATMELVRGRWRVGTAVHVIRIAGGNGTGTYRTVWTPLRIGIGTRRGAP